MTMTRRSSGLAALAVLFAAVGGAKAMTLSGGNSNIVELLQQSNDIVVGKVGAVTDGIDEHGVPYTEVTLNVSETIRGGVSGAYKFRQFGLLAPRPMADGKRTMMPAPPGFPKYVQGEDLVLFLRPKAAWTGFRMPAGVTQGKFKLGPGRLENDLGNAGLFRNLELEQGLATERDKRLLTTASGPVNPDAFLSFVRRAVQERWIESGRITTRSNRPSRPQMPPQSEAGDAPDPAPAAQPPVQEPPTAPLDPRTDITLPRSGR